MNSKRSTERSQDLKSARMEIHPEVEKAKPARLQNLYWDTPLDAASVALVAANVDREACFQKSGKVKRSDARRALRQILIRAITLIQEAQDIITNGPTAEDVPREYFEQASSAQY